MIWLEVLAFLVIGFLLLDKGSTWLVGGGSRIAKRLGMSTLVVGLTVVAWGTSAPEVVVSGYASYAGSQEMALGNVLGSNVANIGLVLAVCGLILPRLLVGRLALRETFWLFGSLAAFWLCTRDGALSRLDSGLFLVLFLVYTIQAWFTNRGTPEPEEDEDSARSPITYVLVGMAAIGLGAYLVIEGARDGAYELGISERVVSLTIVALGTSLPELAAGVRAAMQGESEIALGNVVGSNVFNTLAVLGIVGLVRPVDPATAGDGGALAAAFDSVRNVDLPVVLGFSVAFVLLPAIGGERWARQKAAVLLLSYLGYSLWLYATGRVPVS